MFWIILIVVVGFLVGAFLGIARPIDFKVNHYKE